MREGKLNIASHLQEHTYPDFLMRHPGLIRLIYGWNGLLLQRNQAVRKALRKTLPLLPAGAAIADAGCGEGMHILPYAKKYPHIDFYGVDKNEAHLYFIQKYVGNAGMRNVRYFHQNLTGFSLPKKIDLLLCVGTLQYIADDSRVLKRFYEQLKSDGTGLIYVPVNGRIITPVYQYFFTKKNHYESVQQRKRIYTQKEIIEKLTAAGFNIEETIFTYGTKGILAHEIYSLLLLGMGQSKWWSWLFYPLLMLFFPIIFILIKADQFIPKKGGNGLLLKINKQAVKHTAPSLSPA